MPGGVTIDNLGDLLNTTLPFFPKSKFTSRVAGSHWWVEPHGGPVRFLLL